MPTIEVAIPSYTTIEIDVADHLSEIEVEIEEYVVVQAIQEGAFDSDEILAAVGDEAIVSYIDDGSVEIPDATLLKLIEGRNDLVKLGLSGDLTIEEQAQQLFDRLTEPDDATVRVASGVVKRLVRYLIQQTHGFRGAVTDALGEHYAKAPLEALVPVQIEEAEAVAAN
jgi:hypothetical protein